VVFLHGFISSAAVVPGDEDVLREHNVQIICINRPGVGQSSLRKDFLVEDVAKDIYSVLQQMDIASCEVVGWSAGGVFAQCFAAMYPQQTRSLHLICSSVPFAQEDADKALNGRWNAIRLLDQWVPFVAKPMFRKTSKQLQENPDEIMQKVIKGLTDSDKWVASQQPAYTLLKEAACDGLANEGMGAYEEAKALGKAKMDFTKITCPVHIWAGDDDSILPLKTAEYLHQHIRGSQLYVLHHAGHFLHLKEWKQLVAAFAQAS
jgi:pimeloyl-ACP methyl ester carboxylesterase